MQLRDYQRASIDALYAHFETRTDNPLVVIPTGGGKAPTLCTFIREAIDAWPDTRILVLVHVRELVAQNFQTMLRIWPAAPVTVCSASLGRKNLSGQIVMASIQTVYKHAYDLQRVDLVVVDEAHLIPHRDEGMYRRLLGDLQTINPKLKMVGYTATPFRMTSGRLDEGDGALFGGIAYEIGITELIEKGWLNPLVPKSMQTKFDVSAVHTRGGEFVASELAAAVDIDSITEAAVREIVEYGTDRRSWLAFGSSVRHAENIRDAIRSRGFTAETVTGKTAMAERTALVEAFKAGRIRCLTNCDVLTTGFDAPATDLLAVLRPTRSPGLWVQMLGRGTRLSPGKVDCLVLDFGENSERHGPIDQITGRKKPANGDGGAPVKICPDCRTYVAAGARWCSCGHEFPAPMPQIEATASTAAILSRQIQPEWVPVTAVSYAKHEKPGRAPSLRVDYRCGIRLHREWVTLELSGFPREKACRWWSQRAGTRAPAKVDEALRRRHELRAPKEIAIRPSGKFVEIVGARFE